MLQQPLSEPQLNPPKSTCWGRMLLNPGIHERHFVAMLAHYFMLSFVFVNVDSLQPMLLQDKFHIEKKDQFNNSNNAYLLAIDIVVKLLTAPLFGVACDRLGRRLVLVYGFLCIAFSMALMPLADSFWQLIILRGFYAQAAISISVAPLLADYVHNQKRGVASSVCVFMSACGALSSAYINYTLLKNVQENKIQIQYWVASGLTVFLGLLYSLLLVKPGNHYYSDTRLSRRPTLREIAQVGVESIKTPQLAVCYFSAYLARADSILLSLFLILWTYKVSAGKNEVDFDKSNMQASKLSGIAYSVIMVFCILYGLLFERKRGLLGLMTAILTLIALGVFLINFVQEITEPLLYVSLGILGLGMAGLLTGSLYLVNTYASKQHRGYITGIQTLFGIVGICVQVLVGSLLYQVSAYGPFNLFGGSCLAVLLIIIFIHRKAIGLENK